MPALHEAERRARGHSGRAALAAALLSGFLGVLALPAASAGGAADDATPAGIDVVQVQGLIDPPNASLVEDAVARAERRGSTLLVFQLDSGGAVDVDVEHLADVVGEAEVPVVVWVGPSGADARGGAALLALAASRVVVAQGAGIGPVAPLRLDRPGVPGRAALEEDVRARRPGPGADGVAQVVSDRLNAGRAQDLGVVDSTAPTLGEVIVGLDGETLVTASGPVRISTAEVVGVGANRRREPNQEVRFTKLDPAAQVAHALGRTWVAYLLFVAGAALIVFEFFSAGIGLAGLTGALSIVGACYGFSHLPLQWWAAALLLVGVVGLAVDVQAGGLGAWTLIGTAALIGGSLGLYGGSSRLDPPWWTLVTVCGLTLLFMLGGMTAMVRARFSTPTVGREDLVGETGRAEVDVSPDGVVRVRDALWRAHTNRATPIRSGEPVRVVAVDGLTLEVEAPERPVSDHRRR